MDRQLHASDSLLERKRGKRILVSGFWFFGTFLLATGICWKISYDLLGYGKLGFFAGMLLFLQITKMTAGRFVVKVSALHAFVTVDQLRTFLQKDEAESKGDEKVYVYYGPGFHISYPWESRNADYNVSLDEATEDFKVVIQTSSGIITGQGSVRMRPDITRLIPFLGGVAVVAADVTDLISAYTIEAVRGKNVKEVLQSIPELNKGLTKKFGLGQEGSPDPDVSDFESRFGVSVGDVTFAKLLPSEEVQKTLSGVFEAQIIADGAATILGYKNVKAARRAIKKGELTNDDLNKARDRFMAASDNIKMNLDANEYSISFEGLDKEVVEALSTMAPLLLAAKNNSRGGKNG